LLWRTAEELLPASTVAEFNQALMELGSLVCTPMEPKCGECPLAKLCAAYAAGLQNVVPQPKTKQRFTDLHEVAVVIYKSGRVLMRQCGEEERWAGLWDFPRFAVEVEGPLFAEKGNRGQGPRADRRDLRAGPASQNNQTRRDAGTASRLIAMWLCMSLAGRYQ